jgi:ATP-dependent Clp protease ATP-binding subunit ClpA
MGKLPRNTFAKKVHESALRYAKKLCHKYVGTEHLLLALSSQPVDSVSYRVINSLGVKPNVLEEEVLNLLGTGSLKESQSQKIVPQYWKINIPRTCKPLDEVIEQNLKYNIVGSRIFSVEEDEIGELPDDDFRNGQVIYDISSENQLKEAIKFRKFYDDNGVHYKETPSREKVSEKLRTLANRIEGQPQ